MRITILLLLGVLLAATGCASGRVSAPRRTPTYVLSIGEERIPVYVEPEAEREMNEQETAHWISLTESAQRRLDLLMTRHDTPDEAFFEMKQRLNTLAEQTFHHYTRMPDAVEERLSRVLARLDRAILARRAPAYAAVIALPDEDASRPPRVLTLRSFRFAWPLTKRGELTSRFGARIHPITGQPSFHDGIDLALPAGELVVAAESGRVLFSGYQGASGNLVVLEHEDGYQTYYAHLQETLTVAGLRVSRGQPIGLVGQTGRATGPHLHFKVTQYGHPVNPESLSYDGYAP